MQHPNLCQKKSADKVEVSKKSKAVGLLSNFDQLDMFSKESTDKNAKFAEFESQSHKSLQIASDYDFYCNQHSIHTTSHLKIPNCKMQSAISDVHIKFSVKQETLTFFTRFVYGHRAI